METGRLVLLTGIFDLTRRFDLVARIGLLLMSGSEGGASIAGEAAVAMGGAFRS